jgi:hypothetical protein
LIRHLEWQISFVCNWCIEIGDIIFFSKRLHQLLLFFGFVMANIISFVIGLSHQSTSLTCYNLTGWARQKSYGRDVTFWWCLIVCCLLWRYGADEQCKCILKHHN